MQYEDFVDIFFFFFFLEGGGGHHKIGLYLGAISMHLGSFFKVGIFLGLVKFHLFFRVLEIPDIFWG